MYAYMHEKFTNVSPMTIWSPNQADHQNHLRSFQKIQVPEPAHPEAQESVLVKQVHIQVTLIVSQAQNHHSKTHSSLHPHHFCASSLPAIQFLNIFILLFPLCFKLHLVKANVSFFGLQRCSSCHVEILFFQFQNICNNGGFNSILYLQIS